ncbi:hypothetical protein KTJ90_08315 [Pantoea jilinensis]|nr:hypothetical protein KTJ90_08315 [Pantoea jilinensis]
MKIYFADENIKGIISTYLKELKKLDFSDDFEKNRAGFTALILGSMVRDCEDWDVNSQFNIHHFSDQLTSNLDKNYRESLDAANINLIFVLAFRFYSEFQLYTAHDSTGPYDAIRMFIKENLARFPKKLSEHINYTLYDMPSAILKFMMSGQDFGVMREFLKAKAIAAQHKQIWDGELIKKKGEVDKLREALEKYKTGFNFVALYAGFNELGRQKKVEIRWARTFMLLIGFTIPLIMAYSLYHFVNKTYAFASVNELVIFLPASAITLVMLYYFRVSLANYNSIRAQLMQIELRKSLCQFIQDYSKYSSEISKQNAGLLSKFEDIIFSNIMTSEEKIPSTFDGLEQIATLIKAVKVK